jgi:hypothetical protein
MSRPRFRNADHPSDPTTKVGQPGLHRGLQPAPGSHQPAILAEQHTIMMLPALGNAVGSVRASCAQTKPSGEKPGSSSKI